MRRRRNRIVLFCAAATISAVGCGEGWLNQTAPLGGSTVGGRGDLGVIVLNNTPYRAVLTLGSYDQIKNDIVPDVRQFTLDGSTVLDGEADSGLLTFSCARVFSLGGPRLLALIESSDLPDLDAGALIEGVEFFAVDEADASIQPASQGMAAPFEVLLGVDFPCGALLIFKLEVNDSGDQPFRVDYELIPSSNAR